MNVKKMFLMGLVCLGLFIACDKDDDVVPENSANVVQDSKNYFVLDFQSYESNGDTIIEVYFSASNIAELPLLVVNGDTIKTYYLDASTLYSYDEFPFAESVEYAVSLGGKTTSGVITMPKTPELSCNGTLLTSEWDWTEENPDTISLSDQYDFTWESSDQPDYYNFSYEYRYGYYSGQEYVSDHSKQLSLESDTIVILYLNAYNGVLIQPGATPNVKGAYGDGYVRASSFTRQPYILIPEEDGELKSSPVYEKQELDVRKPYTIEEVLRIVNQ